MKKTFLFLLFTLLAVGVRAYDFSVDGLHYRYADKEWHTVQIADDPQWDHGRWLGAYSGVLVIPSTVTYQGVEYTVTEVGGIVLDYVVSLTVPSTIERFLCRAVKDKHELTYVYWDTDMVPITKLTNSYHWPYLKEVEFGENACHICDNAFSGYESLEEVILSENMRSIGSKAFFGCSNLKKINIPDGLEKLGEEAFRGCKRLPSINIPKGIWKLEKRTFKDCISVKSVTIPGNVQVIDEEAFDNCISINVVDIEEGVLTLAPQAFSCCSNIDSVSVPHSIEHIGEDAFGFSRGIDQITWDNSNTLPKDVFPTNQLFSVTLGNTITSVPAHAFEGMSVDNVIFPVNVTSIEQSAFDDCGRLLRLYFHSTTPPEIINPSPVNHLGGVVYVPAGSENVYRNSQLLKEALPTWRVADANAITYTASDEITFNEDAFDVPILTHTFSDNKGTIYFTEYMTEIKDEAFKDCTMLTSITLPRNLKSIGAHAFQGCTGLQSIIFPKTLNSIASGAFQGCSSLQSIEASSTPTIVDDAFESIFLRGTLTLKNGTAYSEWARTLPRNWTIPGFTDCSLRYVTNNRSDVNLNLNAFDATIVKHEYAPSKCEGFIEFSTPLTTVGSDAFFECSNLSGVDLPPTVTSIADHAFDGCDHLTSITFPDNLTTIGDEAFSRCSLLSSITLPERMTSIGNAAFNQCTKLSKIKSLAPAAPRITASTFATIATQGVLETSEGAYYNSWSGLLPSGWVIPISPYAVFYYKTTDGNLITIPDNADFGTAAVQFHHRSNDGGVIGFSKNLTAIGTNIFKDCTTLTSIIIPNTVTFIGPGAFKGCTSLTDITFPTALDEICDEAFRGCTSLTSVTLPQNVRLIKASAFQDCQSLKTFKMSKGVTTIGNEAFRGCTLLTSVTLSENIDKLNAGVFEGCSSLASIKIPSLVQSIGNRAFAGCSQLKSIISLPETPPTLGTGVFDGIAEEGNIQIGTERNYLAWGASLPAGWRMPIPSGCTVLTYSSTDGNRIPFNASGFNIAPSIDYYRYGGGVIVFDGNLTTINAAFKNCTTLHSITVPESVTTLGNEVFMNCTALTMVKLPQNLTSIGDDAFNKCKSLHSIILPAKVTTIGTGAFENCHALRTINIPSGVTTIADYTFHLCKALTSITIPQGVTSIGQQAFADCLTLSNFIGERSTAPTVGSNAFFGLPTKGVLNVPAGANYSTWLSQLGSGWYDSHNVIYYTTSDNEVLTPSDYSIYDATVITNQYDAEKGRCLIAFSAPITTVGDNAFELAENLLSVTIPDGVTTIGQAAFNGCHSLTHVDLPSTVTSIEDYAFGECFDLSYLIIPEGVTSIGEYAFHDCTSLSTIFIPEGVTTIGSGAFAGCPQFIKAVIPEGVTDIFNSVFEGCGSLAEVQIPEGLGSIGEFAFNGCSSLTSLTLPSTVSNISYAAFMGCSSLSDITCKAITAPSGAFNRDLFDGLPTKGTLHVPVGCESQYQTWLTYLPNGWTIETFIPDDCTFIHYTTPDEQMINIYQPSSLDAPILSHEYGTIVFGGPLTTIGDRAFLFATFSTIEMPATVTTIGNNAFQSCRELTVFTLPQSVTTIEDNAFNACNGLTSLTVDPANEYYESPEGSNVIIEKATHKLMAGTDNSVIPDGVKIIGSSAFSSRRMTSITLPEGVEVIGQSAFDRCVGLTSIDIPEGVTTIGTYGFILDSSLTSVYLPSTLTSLAYDAFYGCSKMSRITCMAATAPQLANEVFDGLPTGGKLYVPIGATGYDTWLSALPSGWTIQEVVPGNVIYYTADNHSRQQFNDANISANVASNNYDTTNDRGTVTFDGVVKTIGKNALYRNQYILSITLPGTLKTILSGAFNYCPELLTLTIPASVTTLEGGFIKYSPSITTLSVEEGNSVYSSPDGCNAIIETATNTLIQGCNTTVVPGTVTSIAPEAFFGFEELTSITLPEGLESVGERAFNCCFSLNNITCLAPVAPAIGTYTFSGLPETGTLTIPANSNYRTWIMALPKGWTINTVSGPEGDVNNDGTVDVSDVTKVVDIILHK